jgi:hypothetical protein
MDTPGKLEKYQVKSMVEIAGIVMFMPLKWRLEYRSNSPKTSTPEMIKLKRTFNGD